MFKQILVPVDVDEVDIARPALDKAIEIAKVGGAALRLIHVRARVPYAMNAYLPSGYYDSNEKASLTILGEIAAKVALPKDRVSFVSPFGRVYEEVLKETVAMRADLIVIGSHRPNWGTYLIGSNAATIVRRALCSVLVVRSADTPVHSL